MTELSRRDLLRSGALAAGALTIGPAFIRDALAAPARAGASPYGALRAADINGVQLPPGFSSRIIARGLNTVPGTDYEMGMFPDGQATFRTADGGWILTTNHETLAAVGGGVSATRFAPDGTIRGAQRILSGTDVNCAGGPTPWGTWLSGEENDSGLVWETDPAGRLSAQARPALGVFAHEAVAVDPVQGHLYLSEDKPLSCLYRFVPDRYPSLASGSLQAAKITRSGVVEWHRVPDPTATDVPTRDQVRGASKFQGGEGLWYAEGMVYFTTKGDKRVWAYNTTTRRIEILFDRAKAPGASLNAVDNVTVSQSGDVLVCEDGGNMEIGIITSDRVVAPLVRVPGGERVSEICGVVFDPSGSRLYFTSQRGSTVIPLRTAAGFGVIYEVSGPFNSPRGRALAPVFGPPAGDARPSGPLNPAGDSDPPGLRLTVAKQVSRGALTGSGVAVRVGVDEASRLTVTLTTTDLAKPRRRAADRVLRPVQTRLAGTSVRFERDGSMRVRLKPSKAARTKLGRRTRPLRARLTVRARDGAGNTTVVTRDVRIGGKRRRRRSAAGRR